jgi:hypothetical protein
VHVIWSATVTSGDIWGGQGAGFSIQLDESGAVWVVDQNAPLGLDLEHQVDTLLKSGVAADDLISGAIQLAATGFCIEATNKDVPGIQEVILAWSRIPPTDADHPEGAVAHLGTDVYGSWEINSSLPAQPYRKREYVLRLAEAWARTVGVTALDRTENPDGVYGGFEWSLGEWIQLLRSKLRRAWVAGHSERDYADAIPEALLPALGVDFLDLALSAGWREMGVAEALLRRGVSLVKQSSFGEYPFLSACSWTDESRIRTLLREGASVHLRSESGDSAIQEAVFNEEHGPEVIRFLIKMGASVKDADSSGRTPLHYAVQCSRAREIVPILLRAGALPNVRDEGGNTVLHALANAEDPSIQVGRMLLAKGGDTLLKNGAGRLPEEQGRTEVFRSWLKAKRLEQSEQKRRR